MRIGYITALPALEPDDLDRTADQGARIDVITVRQVVSNIADCSADPGELTVGQARRAHDIHRYCSPDCLVLRRARYTLNATATGRAAFTLAPDRAGASAV
ncbi:hypothetical protein GV794_20465 [Nocardia cyriacigeorgica]|uniref:Uncharacterized protein n=1 Tax=Nocardia cyriacigeorgica TaxID=135487 RepID=A0ABX0CNC0_9NOCA|nr:hypothetical protein [Nocardia cyriacigeorgica]NEW58009.1 hypothetical protein [Nocardia cyriacigeorgica]